MRFLLTLEMRYETYAIGSVLQNRICSVLTHFFSKQEEITEDDIDDSFKSMFAQLAGEVSPENHLIKKKLFGVALTASIILLFIGSKNCSVQFPR